MFELRLGKTPLSNTDTRLFQNGGFLLELPLRLLARISEGKKPQPFPTHFKNVHYRLLSYDPGERNLNLSAANWKLFYSTACLK